MNFIRMGSLLLLAWPVLSFGELPQKSPSLENYSAQNNTSKNTPLSDLAQISTVVKPAATAKKPTEKFSLKKTLKKYAIFTKRDPHKATTKVTTQKIAKVPVQKNKKTVHRETVAVKKPPVELDKKMHANVSKHNESIITKYLFKKKAEKKRMAQLAKAKVKPVDPTVVIKKCNKDYQKGAYSKALLACQKAAEQNDTNAQFTLAKMYSTGQANSAPDYVNAHHYLEMAAKQNHPEAQFLLALNYQNGIGVKKDTKVALTWYQRAVANGLADAASITTNDTKSLDTVSSITWPGTSEYKQAMKELKNADTHEEALTSLTKAAELGHPIAQYHLAMQYVQGQNLAQDDAKANQWLTKSAEKNYQPAQAYLAWMTLLGLGTQEDSKVAIQWFLEARQYTASNDIEDPLQDKLAVLTSPAVPTRKEPVTSNERQVEFQRGVELIEMNTTSVEGLAIVTKMAEKNMVSAQFYLARLYEMGDKVQADPDMSVKWYQRAAQQGSASAHYALGWHYYNGEGLPKNTQLANKSFQQASKAGDERAKTAQAFLALDENTSKTIVPAKPTRGIQFTQKLTDNVKGILEAVGINQLSGLNKKS